MQRELVILRHAKSDWPDGVPDLRRPLNDRGSRDAPAAGRWIAGHVARLDLVRCSPARRTRQTWELLSAALADPPPVEIDDRIYEASAGDLVEVVQGLPSGAASVLLIGHNPGVEYAIAYLSGQRCTMKTSSIAVLTAEGEWADAAPGWARLAATATPRG